MPTRGPAYLRRRGERGASLVEYAFVLLLFLSVTFGISAFGHALYVYHFLNNAAKEATRWASVNGSTCNSDSSCNGSGLIVQNTAPATAADVTTFVTNITPTGIDPTQVTVTTCGVSDRPVCTASSASGPEVCTTTVGAIAATPNYPGCTVQVQVQYNLTFIFPLISTTSVPMSSTSDMIIVH